MSFAAGANDIGVGKYIGPADPFSRLEKFGFSEGSEEEKKSDGDAPLLILAIGAAAELVPLASFPGKDVLRQERCGPAPTAVVNNKIYVFGGCYPIPYIVDPFENDGFGFATARKTYNVSDETYSYNMDTDEWQQVDTVTPYPFKSAYSQGVGDAVYFLTTDFDNNKTRQVDMWKYHTVEKTWDQVNHLPFVWHGSLIRTECDGKIYITGSDDGHQLNIIHVYDTETNTWHDSIVINSHQLRIRKMMCSADGVVRALAEVFEKNPEMMFFGGSRKQKQKLYSYIIYANGSVTQDDFMIEHYQLDRASILGDELYFLDRFDDETYIYSINLKTHERRELGTIHANVWRPLFVPHGDALFLIGGSSMSMMTPSNKDQIRSFHHKFTLGNKFTVQN
ncbi:hypothetical protein BJV82DRAFT_573601 [Fennellomyces sp. T-0311]|nr:hypothetical protein BJV82DRAFT_573601 [Fennellomyces sp. T-0311]